VTRTLVIPERELRVRASRSGGPGGQHANTSDTSVEVIFDVESSASLGPRQRARLLARFGPQVTARASDTRSQARNRELARGRLRDRLAGALRTKRRRRPTRPTVAAKRARVDEKRRRSRVKELRRRPGPED